MMRLIFLGLSFVLLAGSELGFFSVSMSIAPQAERVQAASDALNLPGFIIPELMLAIGYPATDAVELRQCNLLRQQAGALRPICTIVISVT